MKDNLFSFANIKIQFPSSVAPTPPSSSYFLPCNFIVEAHENGNIEVSAVDPIASMISVKNEKLGKLALEIQEKVKRVIENLK